jgi:uncharacterized protein YndB with AHSA1/START domain
MNPRSTPAQRTVELTRVFDAPRERVFAAWTQPRHLAQWFGPSGYAVHSCQVQARPGGIFRLCSRSPDGKDYWVRGVYQELEPPGRLVIVSTADDEYGHPALEERVEVTLADEDGHTRLVLRASAAGTGAQAEWMLRGMGQMWSQTVRKLDEHLASGEGSTRRFKRNDSRVDKDPG